MEKKQKKEYIKLIILSVVIVLLAISMIFTASISKFIERLLYDSNIIINNNDLVVHFIDVGQGDAIALKFPNEDIMLIDSGPKNSQNYLIEYLNNNVISNDLTINYLILTHSDIDHSGGMSSVFAEFQVENFFRPNIASLSENGGQFAMSSTLVEYNELINLSKQEEELNTSIINKNYEFHIGEAYIQIFAPTKTYSSTNEMSPIIKVSYLNKSFLFTGDIEEESEEDFLNIYAEQLDADVLKVAHHGSISSTSKQFVEVVSPNYAVICVGNNAYGQPHLNIIANLENVGAQVLTTKENAVRIVCGIDRFGVLEEDIICSDQMIEWWMIALVIEIFNIFILIKKILKIHSQKTQ